MYLVEYYDDSGTWKEIGVYTTRQEAESVARWLRFNDNQTRITKIT